MLGVVIMSLFRETLTYLEKTVYDPNHLNIEFIQKEKQNSNYGSGTFELAGRTVRFRVAKKTPAKIGQFVAFWKKDQNNKNQPYSSEEAAEL